MNLRYTKAGLEQIVLVQLENLDAMHDLLTIMKIQNQLVQSMNKKLKEEVAELKTKTYKKGKNK